MPTKNINIICMCVSKKERDSAKFTTYYFKPDIFHKLKL